MKKTLLLTLLLSSQTFASGKVLERVCRYIETGYQSLLPQNIQKEIDKVIETFPEELESLNYVCKTRELAFKRANLSAYKLKNEKLFYFKADLQLDDIFIYTIPDTLPKFKVTQTNIKSSGAEIETQAFIPNESNGTTILMRTPYAAGRPAYGIFRAVPFLSMGYNVVYQPIRGTFNSMGEFDWLNWKDEREDARATLDWIVSNEWSNKNVILTGTSYNGFAALAAASTNHPSIIAAFSASAPTNLYEHSMSQGNSIIDTLWYTRDLNWQGMDKKLKYKLWKFLTKKYAEGKLDSITKNSRTYKKLIKKYEANIPFDNNDDLFEELKKVNFPIVHSLGLVGDQDSKDSFYNYKKLKDFSNNYLLLHRDGHSGKSYENFLHKYAIKTKNKEEFQIALKDYFQDSKICIFSEGYDKKSGACFKDLKDYNQLFRPSTSIMLNGKDQAIGTHPIPSNRHILGPIKIRIKYKSPVKLRKFENSNFYKIYISDTTPEEEILKDMLGGETSPPTQAISPTEHLLETNFVEVASQEGRSIKLFAKRADTANIESIEIEYMSIHLQSKP